MFDKCLGDFRRKSLFPNAPDPGFGDWRSDNVLPRLTCDIPFFQNLSLTFLIIS
jgi:hypothetical protein